MKLKKIIIKMEKKLESTELTYKIHYPGYKTEITS
jgi:hypothetical protein